MATLQERTEGRLRYHRTQLHATMDGLFAWVMIFQYVLVVGLAFARSPWTYTGAVARTNPHVWTALLLGGVLAAYPVVLAMRRPGEAMTRYLIAVSQALFSALLIHITDGRLETHFHVLGTPAMATR